MNNGIEGSGENYPLIISHYKDYEGRGIDTGVRVDRGKIRRILDRKRRIGSREVGLPLLTDQTVSEHEIVGHVNHFLMRHYFHAIESAIQGGMPGYEHEVYKIDDWGIADPGLIDAIYDEVRRRG